MARSPRSPASVPESDGNGLAGEIELTALSDTALTEEQGHKLVELIERASCAHKRGIQHAAGRAG